MGWKRKFNVNLNKGVAMKIIVKSNEFERVFLDLLKDYSKFYWAVAWAGKDSLCYDYLAKHKSKIRKIVVGLHSRVQ